MKPSRRQASAAGGRRSARTNAALAVRWPVLPTPASRVRWQERIPADVDIFMYYRALDVAVIEIIRKIRLIGGFSLARHPSPARQEQQECFIYQGGAVRADLI